MTSKLVSELSQVMVSVLEQHPVNAQRAKDGLSLANVVLLRWFLSARHVARDDILRTAGDAEVASTFLLLKHYTI
jgi:2,3-bisphosphoglycerate-independent phosphoglycerate mutase